MTDYITRYDDPTPSRGLSEGVWMDCAQMPIIQSPSSGKYFDDDFMDFIADKYVITANSGTFAAGFGEGGIAVADTVAGTAGLGPNVQAASAVFKPKPESNVHQEWLLTPTVLTGNLSLFAGLSEVSTAVMAEGVLSSQNAIGFNVVAGVSLSFVSIVGGVATTLTGLGDIVVDQYTRLGFRVATAGRIDAYVNGVLVGSIVESSEIPQVEMVPTLSLQAAGTIVTADVDYHGTFQDDD